MRRLIAVATLLVIMPAWASAQSPAQSEYHQSRGQGYVIFFGLGGPPGVNPITYVGGGGEGFLYKGCGLGFEAGLAGQKTAIASWDLSYHFRRRATRGEVDPFVLGGATVLYPPSDRRAYPGGNFGGGLSIWLTERAALRLEVRDHVCASYACSSAHYISFRVGVTFR